MKRLLGLFFVTMCVLTVRAQMMVAPYLPEDMDGLTANNIRLLENRLSSIISQNGMLSAEGSRFILTMNWNVLEKEVVSSAPTVIMYKLEVGLCIGDGMTGTKYASTVLSLKGAGNDEAKAVLKAMNGINAHKAEIGQLVKKGLDRIVKYYETNKNQILTSAKSMMNQKNYEEAMWILSQIPQEVSYYSEAQSMIVRAYRAQVNTDAARQLQKARALWAASPSRENADAVMALVGDIDPSSSSYAGAQALMKEVKGRVKGLDDADRAEEMRQNAHLRSIDRARINAARDIAVAYAKSRPRVVYNTRIIRTWW
ncbi:MAG: hypothetical protein IJ804_08405 [Prevotella sp.]|nr:hypothetical protein [Prevotella sp.]